MRKKKQEKNQEPAQLSTRVVSGLFWKFGERVLAQVISFIVSLVLARMILPEEYGVVALVTIFITFADVLATSGFSSALIQKKDADELDFSSVFYCSLGISIVTYIILFFVAPLIASFYNMPMITLIIRVFSLRIPLAAFNSVQHAYVSRHMIFKKFFFSTLFGTLVSAAIGIFLAIKGFGVWALVAQYMSNSLIDSIVLLFTVKWRPRLMFSWKRAKGLLQYGWKILFAEFSGTFFNQLKGLIIGKVYTSADLAFFNRGNNLVGIATENIRTSTMSVLFPAMSNIEDDKERIKSVTRRSISVMAYVIFPLALGLFLVAEPLIVVLLTDTWLPTVFFLRIAAVVAVIEMIGHVSLQCLKAIGRSDLILRNEIINKPPYIAVLIIGINTSVELMCVLLLLTSLFGTFINVHACKKCIKYRWTEITKDLLSPLLPCLAMTAIVLLINILPIGVLIKLIAEVALGGIAYVLTSIVTKNDSFIYLKDIMKRLIKKK